MENSFTPITRFHVMNGGNYPSYPPHGTRRVKAEDYIVPPEIAEDWVHAGAVALFRGPAADFLEVAEETRSHLLWQATFVNNRGDLARHVADFLQLVAIDAHNAAIAMLQLGQSDGAKAQSAICRDALRGWAHCVVEDDLPADRPHAIVDAYLSRQPDTLVREFYRLKEFLDENNPE